MDIQRRILIVALAIVAYFIVLQWSKDYGQGAQPDSLAAAPAATDADGKANQDVPRVDSKPATTALEHPSEATKDLIRVRTDVLDLAIDPRGGDVVQLSLLQYSLSLDHPDVPFRLLDNAPGKLYYLAQSGLTGRDGPDARSQGRPLYSSEQRSYQLADGQQELVVDLHFAEGGVNYLKRFTFHRGLNDSCSEKDIRQHKIECMTEKGYRIDVSYQIDNQSGQPWSGNLFAQLQRDNSKDPSSQAATSVSTYLGAAMWTPQDSYRKISERSMDKKDLRENVKGGWIAWLQHYFVSAWVSGSAGNDLIQTRKNSQGNYLITSTGPAIEIPSGGQGQAAATLFAGPKIQKHLGDLAPGLELTVDYGFLWFLAQPIFWLLQHIHSLLGNWGWSIMVLTFLIKLLFLPLSASSYRSMARMRAVAPRLQALREQYGEDRQKLSIAMMELYKKEKINPVGGCLPMLVQMPVFLALYWVLLESVEMRQAPWILWINDLSIKDPFFVLPIIMGATMFIQQQLNPAPPDPMQARMMKIMPIAFTFFFLWFPAGLVLYWIVNNSLSILQQWFISRQLEPKKAKAA